MEETFLLCPCVCLSLDVVVTGLWDDDKLHQVNMNWKIVYLFYNIILVTFVYKLLDFLTFFFFFLQNDSDVYQIAYLEN